MFMFAVLQFPSLPAPISHMFPSTPYQIHGLIFLIIVTHTCVCVHVCGFPQLSVSITVLLVCIFAWTLHWLFNKDSRDQI